MPGCATSAPVPMAMPRSAWASAGASLIPSPTIATVAPPACSRCDGRGLVRRQDLGHDPLRTDPDLRRRWPPRSRAGPRSASRPRRRSARSRSMASAAPGLTVSARPMTPIGRPSRATQAPGGRPEVVRRHRCRRPARRGTRGCRRGSSRRRRSRGPRDRPSPRSRRRRRSRCRAPRRAGRSPRPADARCHARPTRRAAAARPRRSRGGADDGDRRPAAR